MEAICPALLQTTPSVRPMSTTCGLHLPAHGSRIHEHGLHSTRTARKWRRSSAALRHGQGRSISHEQAFARRSWRSSKTTRPPQHGIEGAREKIVPEGATIMLPVHKQLVTPDQQKVHPDDKENNHIHASLTRSAACEADCQVQSRAPLPSRSARI